MPNPYQPAHEADIARLIADYPLAWLVSPGNATPLPLLAETDAQGRVVALFGHIARSNPQVAALETSPRAGILFQGPHAYIPARLVSRPDWGPTWNYAVVRFEVEVTFVPEETEAAIARLVTALERDQPEPWTPEHMGARRFDLLKRIVAFRAHVLSIHPRFKLGQDETSAVFDEIVAGLDDSALAAWMTRTVRG